MSRQGVDRLLIACCVGVIAMGCGSDGGGGASSGGRPSTGPAGGILDLGTDTVDPEDGGDTALEIVADAAAGRELYQDVLYACFVCHGDTGAGTVLGPSILQSTAVELQGVLTEGSQHTGGTYPPWTGQDYADLAAFLDTENPPVDIDTNGIGPDDATTNGLVASPVTCPPSRIQSNA
jgi:mono/diheme cytochrome c family protein